VLCEPALDPTMARPSIAAFAEGFFLTADGLRQGWEFYLRRPGDAGDPYAAPLCRSDLAGLPPTLVITAEYDPLRDEAEEFGRRLLAAGVAAQVSRYVGMIHGFELMTGIVPDAQRSIDEVAAFIAARGPVRRSRGSGR
jgi:acetyl esterase